MTKVEDAKLRKSTWKSVVNLSAHSVSRELGSTPEGCKGEVAFAISEERRRTTASSRFGTI
jgi:hypothetical protein